jgi:hypothetical protein
MTPPGASSVAGRATTLLVLTALMLFQLLSRADLALVGMAQQHGSGVLCANAGGGPGDDGPQNGHRACALACAMLCHAQILPGTPAVAVSRPSQVLTLQATLRDAGRGRPSIQSLRIRGPPETGLV